MAISGIYCIENIVNGMKYIGQSKDINHRLIQHKSNLKHNRHGNPRLQNAWNKYGINSFKFYILEECDIDDLNEREKFYIRKYNSYSRQGYNLSEGGDPGVNSVGKKIKQYDIDGNFIRLWNNAAEAGRYYDIPRGYITNAVRNNELYHDSQWCYENETIDGYYLRKNQFPLAQYDLDNNLVNVYKHMADVTSQNNEFQKENIFSSMGGHWRKTAYGYIWKRITKEQYYELYKNLNADC